MKTDIWMRFPIGDHLKDTSHFSTEDHGAYLLLYMSFWVAYGKVEYSDARFANIARVPVEQWLKHFKPLFQPFFIDKDGCWLNETIREQRLKADKVSLARSEAGRKGGRPTKPDETKPK